MKHYSLFTYFGSSNFFWFLLHNESLWRNCFVELMPCTSTFWKCVWFENVGSITKVMNVEVKNVPLRFCPFFTFGIVGWRFGKIAADFYPQLLKNRLLQPVYLLRIVIQLVEMLACLLPCSGWQTNDISHAAFTQARWNGAKVMAPRWRHDRAKKFPVRASETKRVKITLPCFKSLTAADLSPKNDFHQLFNIQGPVISECTIVDGAFSLW